MLTYSRQKICVSESTFSSNYLILYNLATAEIPNSYFFVKLFVWFSFYASFCNSDHFMGTRGDHMAPSSLWGNTYNLSSLYSSKIQKYQSYSSKIPKYLLLKLLFLNTKLNHILIKVCFRNHKGITYSNLIILVFKIWTWRKILDLVFVKLSYSLTRLKRVFFFKWLVCRRILPCHWEFFHQNFVEMLPVPPPPPLFLLWNKTFQL